MTSLCCKKTALTSFIFKIMADKRISQLVERTDIANNDVVPIVASGATTTNKATISSIQEFMQENLDLGVTSVGITLGTTGTDVSVSGSPITTSGNITINIPTASATNRGLLSSADWTTFNNKQPAGNYVTLDTAQTITAQKTFTTSGSSDTMIISHGSGSGFALDVIKAGNGEAIRVTKTSGSGNAMSITGGNFSAQAATFSGVVTTTPDAVINGVNVGKGGGALTTNTRLGSACLSSNTTGTVNTSVGYGSLQNNTIGSSNTSVGVNSLQTNTGGDANTSVGSNSLTANTTGDNNTSVGAVALYSNTSGTQNTATGAVALYFNTVGNSNTAVGLQSAYKNTTGNNNVAVGLNSLFGNTTGTSNTALGHGSGHYITDDITENSISNNSVFVGSQTKAQANNQTNQIVIGHLTTGNGSNTVTIGNSSITDNYFTGNIRGGAFIRTGGTSSQFLKADGSVDSSTYLTTGTAASTYVPYTGATGGVDLGTHSLSSNNLIANGGLNAGALLLKNANAASTINTGYLTLSPSSTTTRVTFGFSTGASTWKSLSFSSHLLTDNTPTIFSFPNGGGTLAVTTDLGAYLPLTGGTLTGALNGTSASFSGNGQFGNASTNTIIINANTGNPNIEINGGVGSASIGASSYLRLRDATNSRSLFLQINANGGLDYWFQYGGVFYNRITFENTGAATFSSSVTATSETTDSSMIQQWGYNSNPSSYRLRLNTIVSSGLVKYSFDSLNAGTAYNNNLVLDRGNVGIGTASPNRNLDINGNLRVQSGTIDLSNNFENQIYGLSNSIYIKSNGLERALFSSQGYSKFSNTGTYFNSGGSYHELRSNLADEWTAFITNPSASPYGIHIRYPSFSSPNTSNFFLVCSDSIADRLRISSNGDVVNQNNSYGAISDIKLKENITDATPKLDDLLKVKVRNYNLIGEETKQIGVIAQELEEVFPAMIDESEDFEEVEVPQLDEEGNEVLNEEGEVVTTKQRVSKGTTTKSVKYSVFVPMLIKAIQEQQEQIQELKTEIDSLKNQIK
jgi:hypothetical protein